MQRKTTLLLPLLAAALVAGALAQAPADIGPGIGQKMKQNLEDLRQYSFKRPNRCHH
jgi:outer membrane lipoprotein-sorting protein